MSKNKNAQYQQNVDIIKGFFRKPIVLVVGVLTLISTICHSVASYVSSDLLDKALSNVFSEIFSQVKMLGDSSVAVEVESSFSLNFFAIAMGIAFILLFAFGRNKKNAIRGGATYFKVLATIEYVICFILTVCCVILAVATCVIKLATAYKAILVFILALVGVFLFISGYSKLRFAKSVCNSMDSIYLEKKGANLFAVISFIVSAFFLTACSYIIVYPVDTTLTVALALDFALNCGLFVCTGIMAVKFSRYINGIEKGTVALPVNTKAVEPEKQDEWICSNCGTAFTDEDIFCHVCGNKLR